MADNETPTPPPPFSSPINQLGNLFPFAHSTSSVDVEKALATLRACLPPQARALSLYSCYMAHASTFMCPISEEEVREYLPRAYEYADHTHHRPHPNPQICSHRLATVFLVLAIGALVDLDLPPYSSEADQYYNLG